MPQAGTLHDDGMCGLGGLHERGGGGVEFEIKTEGPRIWRQGTPEGPLKMKSVFFFLIMNIITNNNVYYLQSPPRKVRKMSHAAPFRWVNAVRCCRNCRNSALTAPESGYSNVRIVSSVLLLSDQGAQFHLPSRMNSATDQRHRPPSKVTP